jgi:hypothetical protein
MANGAIRMLRLFEMLYEIDIERNWYKAFQNINWPKAWSAISVIAEIPRRFHLYFALNVSAPIC